MTDPVTLGTIGMAASGASGAAGILVRSLAAVPKPMLINISRRWHGKMLLSPSRTRNMLSMLANSRLKAGIAGAAQAGQIKAAQGASGVDVNSGSAKEVQTSQHLVSQMDLNTIREKAAKTAYDFSVQATNYENQARAIPKPPVMPAQKVFLARFRLSLALSGPSLANGYRASSLVCGEKVEQLLAAMAPIR